MAEDQYCRLDSYHDLSSLTSRLNAEVHLCVGRMGNRITAELDSGTARVLAIDRHRDNPVRSSILWPSRRLKWY